MSKNVVLKDKEGNQVMPITHSECVYIRRDQTLADILRSFSDTSIGIVTDANTTTSEGVYRLRSEITVFETHCDDILIVSKDIDAAMGNETILQVIFKSSTGSIKKRTKTDAEAWTAWETVGEVDLGNYYTKPEVDNLIVSTLNTEV